MAQLCPQALGSLSGASDDSQGYGRGNFAASKSTSRYDCRSVSQYAVVSITLYDLWSDNTFYPKVVV
jgi:hypothetical protein